MARPTPASAMHRLRQRLRAYRWQRVGVLAGVSLVLGGLLVAYLFGWTDHFLSRLATAFFVGFGLLAVTFLAILPFVGWAAAHWFGPGWAAGADTTPLRSVGRAAPRPVSSPFSPPKPSRYRED